MDSPTQECEQADRLGLRTASARDGDQCQNTRPGWEQCPSRSPEMGGRRLRRRAGAKMPADRSKMVGLTKVARVTREGLMVDLNG